MASEHDFSEELADLVTRPASEATAASPPWNARRSAQRDAFILSDGYRRYVAGDFTVDVSPWGLIGVRASDWLSKYAQAIHGERAVKGRFARLVDGRLAEIANEDWIDTGEALVHLPTFNARAEEENGFRIIVNGEEHSLPKVGAEGVDPEAMLRRAIWRHAAENGEADELAASKLEAESSEALDGAVGFFGGAVSLAKPAVIETIRAYLQDWLTRNGDVGAYDEEAKQNVFRVDEEETIRILYYEFITGTGESKRVFDESHSCALAARDGTIGRAISRDLGKRRKLVLGDDFSIRPFGLIRGDVPFSPDHAGALASLRLHFQRGMDFTNGSPTEIFLGGLVYVADTSDWRFGPSGAEYKVTAKNVTSLTSLFAHARSVMNVERPEDFERALSEAEAILPYSSITQEFVFYLPALSD